MKKLLLIPIAIIITLSLIIFSHQFGVLAISPLLQRQSSILNTLTRQHEPILIEGELMPDLLGVPLDDIFVYAYHPERALHKNLEGGWF